MSISEFCQAPVYSWQRCIQKCTQQQKWQKIEHNGEFGKNDNFAIKVGDTGKFGKYGKNDNFATFTNKAKHKAMRGPKKVGDTGEFGKYGEYDNFATIANRAWKFTNGSIYNGYKEIQRIMWSLPISACKELHSVSDIENISLSYDPFIETKHCLKMHVVPGNFYSSFARIVPSIVKF